MTVANYVETKPNTAFAKPVVKDTPTPAGLKDYPLIEKAVVKAVQEYGETLKKLAREDS